MRWLTRLFTGRQVEDSPFGLDIPDHPAAAGRIAPPRRRGRTPEQQEADWREYCQKLQAQRRATFEWEARRAQAIGCTHYRWRGVNDSVACPVCKAKEGKRFAFAVRPKGGHPGDGECCPDGQCRCCAVPILPRG